MCKISHKIYKTLSSHWKKNHHMQYQEQGPESVISLPSPSDHAFRVPHFYFSSGIISFYCFFCTMSSWNERAEVWSCPRWLSLKASGSTLKYIGSKCGPRSNPLKHSHQLTSLPGTGLVELFAFKLSKIFQIALNQIFTQNDMFIYIQTMSAFYHILNFMYLI